MAGIVMMGNKTTRQWVHLTFITLVVLYDGFFVFFFAEDALSLSMHSSEWVDYPQGYGGLWHYQSFEHYLLSAYYLAIMSLLSLGGAVLA